MKKLKMLGAISFALIGGGTLASIPLVTTSCSHKNYPTTHINQDVYPSHTFDFVLTNAIEGLPKKIKDVFLNEDKQVKDIYGFSFYNNEGKWHICGHVNDNSLVSAYGCHNLWIYITLNNNKILSEYVVVNILLPESVDEYPDHSINILHATTVDKATNLLIYPYSRYDDAVNESIRVYKHIDFAKTNNAWWGTSKDNGDQFNIDVTNNVPGLFTAYGNVCWNLLQLIPGFNAYMAPYCNVIVVYDLGLNYNPDSHAEELFAASNHAKSILQEKNPVGWSDNFGKFKCLLGFKDLGGGQAQSISCYGSAKQTFVRIQPTEYPIDLYGSYDAWGFYHEFVGHCISQLGDEYPFQGAPGINDNIEPENQYIAQHDFDSTIIRESLLQADYVSDHPWYQYGSNSEKKSKEDFFWYPLERLHKKHKYLNVVSTSGYRGWRGDRGVYTSADYSFMRSDKHVKDGAAGIWTGWYRFLLWKKFYINSEPNDYRDFAAELPPADYLDGGTSQTNWVWRGETTKQQYDDLFGGGHIRANYEFMSLFRQQVNDLLTKFIKIDEPFAKLK